MSFWDGSRWVEESATPAVNAKPQKRLTNWFATGIMLVALVGLVAPTIGTSAATLSGSGLLADWTETDSIRPHSEKSASIKYVGRWRRADHQGHLGGHVRFAETRGAKASMTFVGSGISWIGPVGPTRGKANVYLDGDLVKTVSTFASRFRPAQLLFKEEWSSVGKHRIDIVVLGTEGHPTVAIDALVIRSSTKVTSNTAPPAPTVAPATTPRPTSTAAPTGAPTAAPTAAPTRTPAPTVAPTPAPTVGGSGTYAAIFSGDATGATDVTSALKTFLQSHNGQRVALAVNGVYKVNQLSFTASNLTLDFRGARIQGSTAGARGIFRVQTSTNIVLNDPKVYGTAYAWSDSYQNEHGIQIDGGSNITVNRPVIRNTRGDGIYTSYQSGKNSPPTGVVINNPDIERASRNGIAPVAGQVTIRGGHIAYTGLHAIDFEVNDSTGAASIRGIVDGVDIRRHGDLPAVGLSSYAVAAGGYSNATKPSMLVENLTGDNLKITIRYTASVTVRNNVSDSSTTADFPGSGSVTFTGNVRITRK